MPVALADLTPRVGKSLGGFFLDVIDLERFVVKEHASMPHVRLSCIHERECTTII